MLRYKWGVIYYRNMRSNNAVCFERELGSNSLPNCPSKDTPLLSSSHIADFFPVVLQTELSYENERLLGS